MVLRDRTCGQISNRMVEYAMEIGFNQMAHGFPKDINRSDSEVRQLSW